MATSTVERLIQEAAAGRSPWKLACRAVATGPFSLTGLVTIDNVAIVVGDRVLLTGQAAPETNGIYIAATTTWARALDFDANEEAVIGLTVTVTEGTLNALTIWRLTVPTTGVISLGVTPLTFAKLSTGGGSSPTVSSFTSGTPTLVLNAINELSGSVSAPTLPAGVTPGDRVWVAFKALASDIVITRSAANTINGATTYTMLGTGDPYSFSELTFLEANVWVATDGDGTSAPVNSSYCLRDASAGCKFAALTATSLLSSSGGLAINAFTGVENHQKSGVTARTDTLDPVGANTVTWVAGVTSLTDSIAQSATGVGVLRSTYGQQGLAGNAGGVYKFGGGAGGTPGTNLSGEVQIDCGTPVANGAAPLAWVVGGAVAFRLGQLVPSWIGAASVYLTSVAALPVIIESSTYVYVRSGVGQQIGLVSDTQVQLKQDTTTIRTDTVALAYVTTFATGCTSVTTTQADNTTNSATGSTLKYQAQNATGTGTTGGKVQLVGGTGTTQNGAVELLSGTTLIARAQFNGLQHTHATQLTGLISPTALGAGPTPNYAPTGFATATVIRQDCSAAAVVSGLAGGQSGDWKLIFNTSATNSLTLNHEDVGSNAANRFFLKGSANVVIPVNGSIQLWYDSTSSRWRQAA